MLAQNMIEYFVPLAEAQSAIECKMLLEEFMVRLSEHIAWQLFYNTD